MNFGTTLLILVLLGGSLLAAQRTERRRRWMTLVFLAIPMVWVMWRWSIYADFLPEYRMGAIAAVIINGLYWLFYGRLNPPGSKGDIKVIGSDDDML